MMISFKPYIRYKILNFLLIGAITAWAVTATVSAVRTQPRIILIGMDDNGTRLITSQADPILARERVKFIKEFLYSFYNYSSDDYIKSVNYAGGLMNDTLWQEKEKELHNISEQMKQTRLAQEAQLLDLREVAETEFEVDLGIHIKTRLQERDTKYRVTLRLAPRKRNTENPYAWEVTSIHETEIN